MVDVCFNVLHYKSIEATTMCIDSLLKLKEIDRCKILILDNGSPNKSFEFLKKRYIKNPIIELLHSDKNLGFSEGNNHLYKYAKSYNPQFIVALNNDIEIRQKNFIKILKDTYFAYKVHIIGPDVYCPKSQEHQSPMYKDLPCKEDITQLINSRNDEINHIDQALELYRHSAKTAKLRKFIPYWMIEIRKRLKKENVNLLYKEKIVKNPVLQGSCIIVTPLFIKHEDLLFTPDTGLYCEEIILGLRCKYLGYDTLYTSKLKVIHWHGIASGFRSVPSREDLILKNKRLIKAYTIYMNLIDNNPWKGDD